MSDFKPGDVYVGVVDFFAVMLPGALLVGVLGGIKQLRDVVTETVPAVHYGGAADWVAFGLISYTAGHFLFMLSSYIDVLYDRYKRPSLDKSDIYQKALNLKNQYFGIDNIPRNRDKIMNPFAWAKSILILQQPAALASVEKYEADSKFFRSLIITLPMVALLGWASRGGNVYIILVAAILSILSCFRYSDRRHKGTEWAYRYIVTLSPQRVVEDNNPTETDHN